MQALPLALLTVEASRLLPPPLLGLEESRLCFGARVSLSLPKGAERLPPLPPFWSFPLAILLYMPLLYPIANMGALCTVVTAVASYAAALASPYRSFASLESIARHGSSVGGANARAVSVRIL
jgi:hypothetical protein